MSGSQSKFDGRVSSASRLSARASVKSATDTVKDARKPDFSSTANFKLKKIVEAEESAMVVYAVREDLLNRVMDQCFPRYLERQTIKFLVDCACTALKQIIDLDFFVHDFGQPFYENHPAWSADQAPEPSPPDTWAASNVPVVTELEEAPSEEEVVVKVESIPSTPPKICAEELTETESDTETYFEVFQQDRRVSFDESHHSITLNVPHVSEVFEREAEPKEVLSKQVSIFSHISKCDDVHTVKNIYSDMLRGKLGSRTQRLSQVAAMDKKLLRMVEVSDNVPKLPPIRADTMLRKASSTRIQRPKSQK